LVTLPIANLRDWPSCCVRIRANARAGAARRLVCVGAPQLVQRHLAQAPHCWPMIAWDVSSDLCKAAVGGDFAGGHEAAVR